MHNRESHLCCWRFTGTLCPDLCRQLHLYFLRQPPPEGATVLRPAWKGRHRPQPPDGECLRGRGWACRALTPGAFLLTEGWPPLPGSVSEGLWSPRQAQLSPLLWEIPGFSGNSIQALKNLRVFVLVLGTPPQGEEEMMKGARWLVGTGTGCRELPLGAPSPQMKEMSGSSSARKGPEPGRARRTQQSPSRCHRPSSPGRVPGAAPCSESPLTSPSSQGEGASGERGDRCGDRHRDRQAGRSKCAGREQGEKAQHQERTLGLKD